MGPLLTVLIIEVSLFQSVHNSRFDCIILYSVSGIRPDIITLPPILPSSITLGLSATATGVVSSMVVLNVNIMLLTACTCHCNDILYILTQE